MLANISWLLPWNSLYGETYQFWSGIGSDLMYLGVVAGVVWRVRKHFECHVESPENCHHFGHPVPGTGHRACRKHHPHAEEKGAVTMEDILHHHEASGA